MDEIRLKMRKKYTLDDDLDLLSVPSSGIVCSSVLNLLTVWLSALLVFVDANRKIHKCTNTNVAFTQEYFNVSTSMRNEKCTNKGWLSSKGKGYSSSEGKDIFLSLIDESERQHYC